MKKYIFKKVLLVIACFSLVIVMAACGSSGSGGDSHASISTDPDNPSALTFPETAEDDDGLFYQSIYNSNVDDPDAEPGTIYGCYQGTSTEGDTIAFIASKPQLSDAVAQKLDENGLKYFAISTIQGEIDNANSYDQIYIFKDEASYDAISRDQKTIKVVGRYIGISLGTENNYMYAGEGRIDETFTTYSASDEEYLLETIDDLIIQ